MTSEYERIRQNNIVENRKILAELGLLGPYKENVPLKVKLPVKRPRPKKPVSRRIGKILVASADENTAPESLKTRRRSERLLGKTSEESISVWQDDDFSDDDAIKDDLPKITFPRFRENIFGAIPGIPVGTVFLTRLEASHAGLHRPTVAGIHGNESEGCYSLALSGGYEDDIDFGDCFTYTGEGGRDLKGTKANPKNLRTAPQSRDQALTRGNLALTKNIDLKKPVRVLRGYKLNSPFAPEEGYRYDGLYSVEKFWAANGKAGFVVFKYALKRCDDQELAPWDFGKSEVDESLHDEEGPTLSDSERGGFENGSASDPLVNLQHP